VSALWPQRARAPDLGRRAKTSCTWPPTPSRCRPRRNIACGLPMVLRHRARTGGTCSEQAEFCKVLWRLWSPNWRLDDATYECTAASFDNPDFVDVVIHSYRHRFGWTPGDPGLEPIEELLAARRRVHRRVAWWLRQRCPGGKFRGSRAVFQRSVRSTSDSRGGTFPSLGKRRTRSSRQCVSWFLSQINSLRPAPSR
jgi:hypothetical protein